MTPIRKQRRYKRGEIVEYSIVHKVVAKIVGFRWVEYPDGSGIWKYRLSNGEEKVAGALIKI